MSNPLLTAKELAPILNVSGERRVKELARKRIIPVIVMGHRTHRFDADACLAALAAKRQVKAI